MIGGTVPTRCAAHDRYDDCSDASTGVSVEEQLALEAQRRAGGCDHWLEIDGEEGYCVKPAGHASVHALSG